MSNILVKLDKVSKKYNDKYIIKDLSLDVYEGEFLTLLGASGCGKTTILRMISGLEAVTSGRVYIDGIDVTDIDPTKRKVNTIFQNFALFPHMTVWDNINFGLKMKKIDKKEAVKRIKQAIKLVKLEGFEDRYPPQLSGGQQQRVAIARGIVMNHKVLLLDESLCSLDLKLKRQMQIELKKLQKKLGMTFIYVTHDQDEALTMSDRIVIINKGIIEQIDTPRNIYRKPKTAFVADFIGESNLIKGIISEIQDDYVITKVDNELELKINKDNYQINETVKLIIRPEDIKITKTKTNNSIKGIITDEIYDGAMTKYIISITDKIQLKVNFYGIDIYDKDDEVYLTIDKENIITIRGKNESK